MATLYDYDDDGNNNNNNNSMLIYMQIQQPKGQKFNQGQDSFHEIFCHKHFSTFVRNFVRGKVKRGYLYVRVNVCVM
jgi:hypothetical protein